MSIEMNMLRELQDRTLGELNPALAARGYFEDAAGNIYYPDGLIMSGPGVNSITRPLTTRGAIPITVNSAAQLITLPNGQQVSQAQYQALLAQQQPQQLVGGGVSNQGVQIGGLNVSWLTLAVIVGGFALIQARPVGRK